MIKVQDLLVDGKKPGYITEFQITYSQKEEDCKATICYMSGGKTRVLTCELEAISFGS